MRGSGQTHGVDNRDQPHRAEHAEHGGERDADERFQQRESPPIVRTCLPRGTRAGAERRVRRA
jgi:hypothetical protein